MQLGRPMIVADLVATFLFALQGGARATFIALASPITTPRCMIDFPGVCPFGCERRERDPGW